MMNAGKAKSSSTRANCHHACSARRQFAAVWPSTHKGTTRVRQKMLKTSSNHRGIGRV